MATIVAEGVFIVCMLGVGSTVVNLFFPDQHYAAGELATAAMGRMKRAIIGKETSICSQCKENNDDEREREQ